MNGRSEAEPPDPAYGRRLRQAREALGISGDELGAAIGVTKQMISHWENGRGAIALEYLPVLSARLSVPMHELTKLPATLQQISDDEALLLRLYRAAEPRIQQSLLAILAGRQDG